MTLAIFDGGTVSNQYNHYQVFISSPGDVKLEREVTLRTIQRISANITSTLRLTLTPNMWEQETPDAPQGAGKSFQDRLNERIRGSNVFILILGARYGTSGKISNRSHTEQEVEEVLAKKQSNPKVTVLCYLKRLSSNPDPGPQERKNLAFRKRLAKQGIVSREFDDHTDFEKDLTHDLYALCVRLRNAQHKIECLSKFFLDHDGTFDAGRSLPADFALIYRPVLRKFEDESMDPSFWHKRLMPNVIFEDSKAIQKLQKLLRLMGHSSKVYMSYDLPNDVGLMNRLWICAPRMDSAMRAAKSGGASFQFERNESGNLLHLRRRKTALHISSPLSAYLDLQRFPDIMGGEWNAELGQIFARDYAILARLPALDNKSAVAGQVSDYFIAGLRGLGTWGVAWYLDRKFKALEDLPASGIIERLLEVTYFRGSIADVLDVTEMPQAYFNDQCSPATIKAQIMAARHPT